MCNNQDKCQGCHLQDTCEDVSPEEQQAEDLQTATYLLSQILFSLPVRRDWLDPTIELAMREFIAKQMAREIEAVPQEVKDAIRKSLQKSEGGVMPCQQTVIKGSDIFEDDYMVQATKIIRTTDVVFTAWRPDPMQTDEGGSFHRCGTITHEEGRWWGRIGTGPDSSKYADLPISDKRTQAVKAAYEAEYQLAYRLILSVHPDARKGRRDMGEFICNVEDVACLFATQ